MPPWIRPAAETGSLIVTTLAATIACAQYLSETDERRLARDLTILSSMEACRTAYEFSLGQEEDVLHQFMLVNMEPDAVFALCRSAQHDFYEAMANSPEIKPDF
jgi:hypothetical protein